MDRMVKLRIIELVGSDSLRAALLQNDYILALGILEDINISYDPFENSLDLFDKLYFGIVKEDINEIVNALVFSAKLSLLEAAIRVVEFFVNLEDEDTREFAKECIDIYFANLSFINGYREIETSELQMIARELIERKNKKYKTVRALKQVFSLPVDLSDRDAENEVRAKYIEGLIAGLGVTPRYLYTTVSTEQLDLLMERVETIAFLRHEYLDLKQKEIDMMRLEVQNSIEKIEAFGLVRENLKGE